MTHFRAYSGNRTTQLVRYFLHVAVFAAEEGFAAPGPLRVVPIP